MVTQTQTPAELFATLLDARTAVEARDAEKVFLAHLPVRLTLWGGIFAYGMQSGKSWARWMGGTALAWTGVEYFAARRRAALAAAAGVAVPDKGARA